MTETEKIQVDGREIEIVYLPGARNHYKYRHDVIVLDERLKDYPLAHDLIREHEIGHGRDETRGYVGLIKHEIEADIQHYLRDDETAQEVRDYYEEVDAGLTKQGRIDSKVSLLRAWWTALLRISGPIYRRSMGARESIKERIR